MEIFNENERVCSITLEPIIQGGMTCYGSVYEYDAIIEWFKNNDTDPLTNLECPSKFVVKVDVLSKYLDEKIKDMRKTTELVFPITKTWTSVKNKYLEYYEIQKNINANILEKDFDSYNKNKRKIFINEKNSAYYNTCTNTNKTTSDIYFDEYGINNFDFINLSGLNVSDSEFKSQCFMFTNLSNTTFINCDMSRCKFIGCDLTGTKFIDCTFVGEEVCFYKSNCKGIIFVDCKMEYIDKWIMTSDANEISKILSQRLIEGNIIAKTLGNLNSVYIP
ncbi:hypothetical protein QLL95_gp0031 [Cotonvirus japonicus]|uniref:Pentapeptide repeat-containing protein n=1 Tax=Cotonvirus japonicus TaxID=2811091 RepID=A0ABM7NQU6_9VIRU|nr:hypothetical protein QLL95_gp0031 [Cotonvirus japonicus]BCS82520.1 hypothetical protein [Cotonvirus japonicus]